jgi:hypothetical protein
MSRGRSMDDQYNLSRYIDFNEGIVWRTQVFEMKIKTKN